MFDVDDDDGVPGGVLVKSDGDKYKIKDDLEDDIEATIRKEATILVDKVLEESINIISGHQQDREREREREREQDQEEQNGFDSLKNEYNSESENYAITCDDIGGLEVVKSPTIESMSGKSFDDNMSFTDEQMHLPQQSQMVTTTTVTATTIVQQPHQLLQQFDILQQETIEPSTIKTTETTVTTIKTTKSTSDSGSDSRDVEKLKADSSNVVKSRRIDRKFEKLSSDVDDVDEQAAVFDEQFDAIVHEDEISNLQGDYSKISWDDSVSPTTNTLGDLGPSTPDNDIQDIRPETGGDFGKSSDTTPVPPPTSTSSSASHDTPTPKPRSVRVPSPTNETSIDDSAQPLPVMIEEIITTTETVTETSADLSHDPSTPVPKPRSQIKPIDSFKNLAALGEQADSVSLRSLDITDELSKTDEPSTEFSMKSQQRDYPTTTATTTASEDRTESFEPTSEISIDDGDTERSEVGEDTTKMTSFYIGESSRNVIIKTTPTQTSNDIISLQHELGAQTLDAETIEAKDIALMKEVSVDSDENNDMFKEYVTMKRDNEEAEGKIVRQSSETRNDILEQESCEAKESKDTTEIPHKTDTSVPASVGSIETAQIKEMSKPLEKEETKTQTSVISEKSPMGEQELQGITKSDKLDLQLEKSEWETSEKQIPQGKTKVVHSPQQICIFPKEVIDEAMVVKTLEEVQESLDAANNELKFVVKDGKAIKESPSEFEFRSISQAFAGASLKEHEPVKAVPPFEAEEDISSFIGIPEAIVDSGRSMQQVENLLESTIKDTLNKEAMMAHYVQDVFGDLKGETKDEHGSLGFISTGTAEDTSSIEGQAAKEEHASLGFISTETAEDFSSMEDYYQENLAKANIVTEGIESLQKTPASAQSGSDQFGEVNLEQTMKPFDSVTLRTKADSSSDSTNRWSVPEVDQSSSSESYYKSFDKNESRPLSSDLDNLLTQANTSEYQTAMDTTSSSACREATEYISAVSTLQSSSGKTISSHDSMKSFDSQSETSANLGSIDVSELSETLVASSTEPDVLEAEEMANIKDLIADDEIDESLNAQGEEFDSSDQDAPHTMMKRSQEMIFKLKTDDGQVAEKVFETVKMEEFPKPKEVEKTWGLAYPIEDSKADEVEKPEDILLYHSDMRKSIDESKLASSLDEGSILSVSMSSTSNVDTVVENFEDMIGSAGSSSLTGIEGFGFAHDEPASSFHEETFTMEMDSKDQSPQDSTGTTPPGETKKRGHKRNDSTAIPGDLIKNLTDAELAGLGENKESESESDTDPYESEYARQFRAPTERKKKKKQTAAAEMDHSFEGEKRPFTPSQLVAEIIVEDTATEELEAEAIAEERRPSQNMQDYSNIPDITVTEDIPKSPSLDESDNKFLEKSLYKVKTQEELHKAADEPLHAPQSYKEKSEEDFQKLVQEQYKQKLAEIQRDPDFDDRNAPDSPDSFEMVDQPDISDEFVIIEEVAKEAGEVDLGGKSIKIQPTKYEQKHDEEVEKIIIKSAPADPKLGSQIYRDDLNFEFEESPPTAGSSSEQQEESDSEMATANKRWVEMQLTDSQLRYPYDIAGGVLEDIKEEDAEFEVGSSRISSFKDSFSSTPEYDVTAARRYYARGDHDDVSMSSLQEFESLEQAISLENRNKTHQGSTDSSNGSFTRRYMVRHSGSGTTQGDDVSVSSLKEFEGLENACIEAHLIEIKAKEEAAMLSRSDESNKSSGSGSENGAGNIVVTKVTRTVTRTEVLGTQKENIEALLKQKLEECEGKPSSVTITEISTEPLEAKTKLDKQDSDKGSVDSLDINKSLDVMTSSIDSFDISKDATTRSDVDSLEVDKKQPTREESIDSIEENEQMDLMTKLVTGEGSGGTALGDGLTTTTTTTTTSTDADGREHTVTRTVTTMISSSGSTALDVPPDQIPKDISTDSLCIEQTTTSSAGTTATYQSSAGNSQMSGSVTSCASSTLMEDSFPSAMTSSFWSHEDTVMEGSSTGAGLRKNEMEELFFEDAETIRQRQEEQNKHQHPQ